MRLGCQSSQTIYFSLLTGGSHLLERIAQRYLLLEVGCPKFESSFTGIMVVSSCKGHWRIKRETVAEHIAQGIWYIIYLFLVSCFFFFTTLESSSRIFYPSFIKHLASFSQNGSWFDLLSGDFENHTAELLVGWIIKLILPILCFFHLVCVQSTANLSSQVFLLTHRLTPGRKGSILCFPGKFPGCYLLCLHPFYWNEKPLVASLERVKETILPYNPA